MATLKTMATLKSGEGYLDIGHGADGTEYLKGLVYRAGADCGPFAGRTLTEGRPEEINGTRVVRFKEVVNRQRACVRYESRPELAALVAQYDDYRARENEARQQRWAAERASEQEKDAPLLAQMEQQARGMIAQIPLAAVRVNVTERRAGALGEFTFWEYDVDGVPVSADDVEMVGVAQAVRPGALTAFATIPVAYVSREMLDMSNADAEAKATSEEAAAREAAEKTRAEREQNVPAAALADYARYDGDAQAAWDAQDEGAWANIRRYQEAIEHQRKADGR